MKNVNKIRTSASGLFLIELIIAILIFAIAASACIGVFVRSHTLSLQAKELNHAVLTVNTKAEEIRAMTQPCSTESLYYSEDFQSCTKEAAAYCLSVTPSAENKAAVLLSFDRLHPLNGEETVIYALPIVHYATQKEES